MRFDAPNNGGFVDPARPLEWSHPLNRDLVVELAVVPNAGWRGGASLRDLRVGGRRPRNGTLMGTAAWGPDGRAGGFGSLSLTGTSTSYVDVGNSDSAFTFAGSAAMSVGFWIYRTGAGSFARMCGVEPTTNTGWTVAWDGSQKPFLYRMNSFSVGTTAIPASTWHHLLVTYDGANIRWYQNGVKTQTLADTGTPPSGTSSFQVGRTGSNNGAAALYDGVVVYSRALTDAQAAELFRESRRGNPDRWRWVGRQTYFGPSAGGGGSASGTWTCTGAATDAYVGAALAAAAWSVAGTNTAAYVAAAAAAATLSASGTASASYVGAALFSAVLTAAGAATASWYAHYLAATGQADAAWAGASLAAAALSSTGQGATAFVSQTDGSAALSATGQAACPFTGASLFSAALSASGSGDAAFAAMSAAAAAMSAAAAADAAFAGTSLAASVLAAAAAAAAAFAAPNVQTADWTTGCAANATFRSANGGSLYTLPLTGAGL